jgi:hypothetical protein
MKKILGLALMACTFMANAAFVNPMKFDGSEAQKKEVVDYIQARVKKEYCGGQVDMCQDSMLRMMEKQNLADFKSLTEAKDKRVMDRVIKDYCKGPVDMCNYTTIKMMYDQNEKASKEKLAW